jgi:integrase
MTRTFDLKKDAEVWAREVERDIQRGNLANLAKNATTTLFGVVADRYENEVVPKLKGKSAKTYVAAAKQKFGRHFIGSIHSADISEWRDELLASGLSAQSVVHRMNTLSSIFAYAESEMKIVLPLGNQARLSIRPSLPPARKRRLRAQELDYLLLGAARAQKRVVGLVEIIALGIETTMRLGELLTLQWSDIDLDRSIAHLRKTKNGDERTVALSPTAVAALRAIPRREGHDRVFAWSRADSFEKAWSRCKERAVAAYAADCCDQRRDADPNFLDDLHFHDLRHEGTSRLFEAGLGIMDVASMTGHKSLTQLLKYTHIAAEGLARRLAQTSNKVSSEA